ncbi:MAG: GHKL domain-containing protein [Firmicutes bacterium]|nr:GHKL domain-containing protein [Bacillota bacterium]
MWAYNLLDIVSTITECLIIYILTGLFCKKPRFQKNVSQLMPAIFEFAVTVFLTHFTELGAVKIFIVLSVLALMIKLCYTISVREIVVVVELSYLLVTMFTESVVMTILNLIYNDGIMTTVDGISVVKWQVYVAGIITRGLLLIVVYFAFRKFTYQFYIKDVVVLSVSFLLAFFVSFLGVYATVNLQLERTIGLDLITTILSMYFIIQFLYSKNVASLRQQEQQNKLQLAQLRQQFTYYKDKQKEEERIRSIYHDMKNHLLMIEGSQSTDASRKIAGQLRTQLASYEDYIHTGNSFLDVIIKDKAEKMREKQIDFSVSIDFDGVDFMEPLDISALFGNGIDNAMEASEKLPEEQRVVLIKARKVQNFVSILVENNCLKADNAKQIRTSKADGFLHGFGISNMEKTAEKYGGTCTTTQENGKFTLKILIPVP